MDLEIVREIGGGLNGVVIVGLAFTVWTLWKELRAQYDKRLEREREHSEQITKSIVALQDIASVVERSK